MQLSRILSVLLLSLAVLFTSVTAFDGHAYAASLNPTVESPLRFNEPLLQQQSDLVSQKADELTDSSQQVQQLNSKKESLNKKLADEQQAIADLKQKIADKKAAEAAKEAQAAPVKTVSYSAVNTAPVGNCGDNYYASYIYGMESGGRVVGNCSTTSRNANGCYGIGQACPGSKVESVCGADYACQNAWFTNYANKYGGWAGAYNFWIGHGWW